MGNRQLSLWTLGDQLPPLVATVAVVVAVVACTVAALVVAVVAAAVVAAAVVAAVVEVEVRLDGAAVDAAAVAACAAVVVVVAGVLVVAASTVVPPPADSRTVRAPAPATEPTALAMLIAFTRLRARSRCSVEPRRAYEAGLVGEFVVCVMPITSLIGPGRD
jgi:hypothetical protein